jgi:hypothetical protein
MNITIAWGCRALESLRSPDRSCTKYTKNPPDGGFFVYPHCVTRTQSFGLSLGEPVVLHSIS